jgi:methylated-DNA-[protein]-cysteine S-methyltransferase
LSLLLWDEEDPDRVRLGAMTEQPDHAVIAETSRQLGDYFAGRRQKFTVKLDFRGTEFQKQVWSALLAIPFGETRSYGQIAEALGRPGASRAVGAANGRNPISIIAPCHRVVGANGALTGFAGGLSAKTYLLAHERRHVAV